MAENEKGDMYGFDFAGDGAGLLEGGNEGDGDGATLTGEGIGVRGDSSAADSTA